MSKIIFILLLFLCFLSCKDVSKVQQDSEVKSSFTEVINKDYELYKPTQEIQAVLFLFGGYPEGPKDIEREFQILDIAKNYNVAVVLLDYNRKLWLEEDEELLLAKKLQGIIKDHELPYDNIIIGGYSSGGIMSLLIGDYITRMKQFYIDPKGVFIIDSPVDLAALYTSSLKNIERNFSDVSVQESNWIIETLGNSFGDSREDLKAYEEHAVFTLSTDNTSNIEHLRNTKIRLYTEPDSLWWKENRMADQDQMNAYYIERLYNSLQEQGYERVEYISTVNKGYRANGDRHPHSWSIVDKEDLMKWIVE